RRPQRRSRKRRSRPLTSGKRRNPIMATEQRHAAVSELTRLLGGDVPEPEPIELLRHLETCLTCQLQLQRLATDGNSWDALDHYLSSGKAGPSETLRQAMKKLREMTTFAGPTQDEVEESKHMALDFLDPPTKPNQLGKLDHYEILQVIGRG